MDDSKIEMTLNRLPVPTWNRMRMNDVRVAAERPSGECMLEVRLPDGVERRAADSLKDAFADVATGMGCELDRLFDGIGADVYRAVGATDGAVVIDWTFGNGDSTCANSIGLETAPGTSMDVVMDFRQSSSGRGTAAVQTRIRAAAGSRIRLAQIHRAGDGRRLLNDVGAVCDAGARLEVVHVVLDGADNLIGCRVDLRGEASSFVAKTGYLVAGDGRLDMNYVANHVGRRTVCDMVAQGALSGSARKLYRGTIDFKRGCAGSKGDEREDVLMLDDAVVNQTIPLILCAEEDVQGNHGSTIGQIGDDAMFYLQSRGMDCDTVCALLKKARLAYAIQAVPDEAKRNELLDLIEG